MVGVCWSLPRSRNLLHILFLLLDDSFTKESSQTSHCAQLSYGRSMASNYNHLTRPAVIAVKDGASGVILRAENYDDLIALEGPGL